MSELAKYKTNLINKLQSTYNQNCSVTKSNYNILINNVLKSNVSNSVKTQKTNLLITQCNSELIRLLNNLNSDIIKVKQFVPPLIQPSKKRKSLFIGINYYGTRNQLGGCINDVDILSNKLQNTYGFGNIKIITDNTQIKPTKANILSELTNLLVTAEPGDLLHFHYSGHGGYVKDLNGDETNGRDELIYPLDMIPITDDELKQIITTKLKAEVTLFAFFDSCYSGTVLDLRYQYLDSLNYDTFTQNDNNLETEGNVFMISGCTDNQTSADAQINNITQGATSWALLSCLNAKPKCSWRELLQNMRNLMRSSSFTQIPQLSTGRMEDIDRLVFL